MAAGPRTLHPISGELREVVQQRDLLTTVITQSFEKDEEMTRSRGWWEWANGQALWGDKKERRTMLLYSF